MRRRIPLSSSQQAHSLVLPLLDSSSDTDSARAMQTAFHHQIDQILQAIKTLLSRIESMSSGAQVLSREAVDRLPSTLSRTCDEEVSSVKSFIVVGPMAHAVPSTSPSEPPSEAPEHVEPCQGKIGCFLPRTHFITPGTHQSDKVAVLVEELKPRMLVRDAFDGFTTVESIKVKTCEECDVVQLVVGNGIPDLTTTASHRVATRLIHRKCETLQAGKLNVGDRILCSQGEQVLQEVKTSRKKNIDIYEIAFKPDVPVLAFDERLPEGTIASKGMLTTRRGGTTRNYAENVSVAATEYSDGWL